MALNNPLAPAPSRALMYRKATNQMWISRYEGRSVRNLYPLIFILVSSCAFSFQPPIAIGSNFPGVLNDYPQSPCLKPSGKPELPMRGSNAFAYQMYNIQLMGYQNDVKQYIDCTQQYVDNADKDIQKIKDSAKKATDDATKYIND